MLIITYIIETSSKFWRFLSLSLLAKISLLRSAECIADLIKMIIALKAKMMIMIMINGNDSNGCNNIKNRNDDDR